MSRDFWSKRRAGVEAEEREDQKAQEQALLAEEQARWEEQSDEDVLAALDLPDPDTMKAGDDFSVFMAKVVPDRIRRRALRTLWKSNPVLANVDMLVDYGEDFTDSATVVENLQTAYQVGKGMMKHVEEMARQAAEVEAEPAEAPEPEVAEEEDTLLVAGAAEAPEPPVEDQIAEPESIPAPRRMKFKVEETA